MYGSVAEQSRYSRSAAVSKRLNRGGVVVLSWPDVNAPSGENVRAILRPRLNNGLLTV